jgi:hypothetical protein
MCSWLDGVVWWCCGKKVTLERVKQKLSRNRLSSILDTVVGKAMTMGVVGSSDAVHDFIRKDRLRFVSCGL